MVPEWHAGFTFQPGQFAWLTIWDSPFALKEHPFSIASSAEQPGTLSFTIKALGDFTARIKEVEIGRRVYVDGPHGSFSADRQPAPAYVFIAGGIGIAPIMGMLRTLADRCDRRPLLLFYAYHTWERLTFREELQALQTKLNLRLVFVLKDSPEGWQGKVAAQRRAVGAAPAAAARRPGVFHLWAGTDDPAFRKTPVSVGRADEAGAFRAV